MVPTCRAKQSRVLHLGAQCDVSIYTVDLHADLPAPDGPISNNFRVGKESSDDMFSRNMHWMIRIRIVQIKETASFLGV